MALKRSGILGKTHYVRYYYYAHVRVCGFLLLPPNNGTLYVARYSSNRKKKKETSSFKKKINSTHIILYTMYVCIRYYYIPIYRYNAPYVFYRSI